MAKTALEKWREENQQNRTATNAKPNKLEQWQQENRKNAPVREVMPTTPAASRPSATSMYGSANRNNSNLMDMATRTKLMQAANEMADIKTRQAKALENPRASTAYARQAEKTPVSDRAKKVTEIRKDINTLPEERSRLGKGVQSVMLSPYASIEYLGESGKQTIKNQKAYEESDLDTKLAAAYTHLMQTERAFGYGSPEYEAAQANYDAVQRELNAFKNAPDKAVDMNSRAAQFMGGVQKLQEEALEGTTGAGRFLGEAALSIGSNLSKLPLNAVVPGASLALMGAEAAAGKAYELGQQGVNAGQALTRGLVSGGIEALTEKVPLDNLVDIIKTGGKVGLMNILKQAATEAGEEGVAYLLNLGADKVAGDPEAEFVWNDFWKSVGMGALSGGIMGGGATAINRANAAAVGKNYQDVAPELVAEGLQMKQDTDAYRTAAEMQRKLDAGKTLSNVDVGRVVQDNEAAANTLRQAAMEMAEEQVEREVQAAMPKRTPVRPIANQQRTAYTESNRTTEGGMTDGEEVHLRESGQRNDRAYPGGEVPRMEESAGRDQSGQDSRLPAKDARAADLRVGEEVSTASLGIGNGASNDRIRVVTGGDTEATAKARAIAKERGLRLTLFTGGNLTIDGEECRAYITGDRAFVRADHSDFDADQLMRHEAGHDQIAKGEIDIKAATENIRKRLGGRNNVQRAAQTYASAFAGADMTVEEAIEEIICDSLGDMNVFSDTAVETAFGEVLESAKAAAGESRVESKTGPPGIRVVSKHSRETINIKAATEQESLALAATDPRNVARLQNDVSAVLNNTFPSWRKVLLGKPSKVLAKYMKSDKPLYLPQSAIKKAILLNKEDGGKHGLGRTVIDELPYQLEDPLAITKNTTKQVSVYPDSIVVWTNWQTESGDSIIVPIYVNADGSVGIHNNISTVFDVYDPDYAADLLRPGNVLYTKNGKNIDKLLSQQREVLKREQADVSSTDSVAQNIGKSKENLTNLGVETDGSSVGKASRETNREDVLKAVENLLAEAEAKLDEQELADQMYYGRKAEVQKRNAREKLDRLREQKNQRIAQVKAEGREAVKAARIEERVKRDERIAQVKAEGREAVKVARIEERAKRDEKLAKQKQRSKDMLDELRGQKNERIAQVQTELKQQAADRQAKMNERGKAAKMRSKITRHVNKMQQMLLRPSDKRHVPEHLRKATASVLSAINMESGYELSFGTDAKYHRVAPGTDPYAEKTAKTKAFEALRDAYNAIVQNKEEDSIIIDPELLGDSANGVKGLFDQFVELGKKPIADMNSAELEVVWKVLRSVEHSIINAGKMLSKSKYETTKAFADAFASDAAMRRDMNRIFGNKLALDFEDPYTFFSHYGESGKAIYRILRNAQDEVSVKVDIIAQKMQELVDTEAVEAIQKERHEFTTEAGDALTLTTGQLMSIYNLMHRQQAHDHLMKGGIVQPEIKRNGKQPRIDRGTEMVPLSANDLQDLAKMLTDEQKKIASELQKMMTGELAKWGNEASMAVYGYEKFTGEDYWPIKSAGEGLNTTVEKNSGAARSIKNIGMAKNTVPHANNALEIGDVFDVFAQHTADMVDYSSWLLPMEDLTRLYNWKYRDENGNKTGKTIKGIMEQKGGKGSQKYLEELLKDIQNGIAHQMDTQTELWINRMIGNAKGASVGANMRVVVQQPTAFLRAAAIFDADSLAKGIAKGVTEGDGWEKAKKYAPIAHIKDVGGFDQGNARTISQQIYGTATKLEAMNEKLSWAAAKADAITWGKLWNAAEWETKKRFPKLEAGSNAFYEKAKELFTDMVDQSQVVDGVLQRTQIMRSGNAINKQASSFMGEPMKTMNMMVRAWDNWRHTEGAERARYKKQMGRTVIALGVTAATNALMQALVDAIRDDDKEKDYLDRVWAAFSGLEGDEASFKEKTKNILLRGNLADNINPIGMYPYASDVLSVMQGYDVTRADADVIADIINNATALFKSASGDGKRTTIYNTKKLVTAIGKMFGVSAVNLGRDIWSVASTIVRSVEDYRMMYFMDRLLYSVDQNKKQFVKILYDAENAGETEQAKFIRNSLLKNGVTEEEITKYTKQHKRDKEDELRQQDSFISAKEKTSANIMKDVQKSKLYQKASDAEKLETKLFADSIADYRTMMEQGDEMLYTPSGDVAKAENAASVGVTDAQYILYKLALEMADANSNGEITQEEFLSADFELSKKQLSFMWEEDRGWSPSTNPYD